MCSLTTQGTLLFCTWLLKNYEKYKQFAQI